MAPSLRDLRAVYDPSMHLAMLSDHHRNAFYRGCLARHPELRGTVAVDLGAGCGLLSAMALQQGLGLVHAVEALPEVARLIEKVVRATGQAAKHGEATFYVLGSIWLYSNLTGF